VFNYFNDIPDLESGSSDQAVKEVTVPVENLFVFKNARQFLNIFFLDLRKGFSNLLEKHHLSFQFFLF
jgi:hypothetical protein